ncbi:MAG: hypothetical protein WCJ81_02575 [bacterium]
MAVAYTLCTSQEYEYTIGGIQKIFGLNDQQIRDAVGQWIVADNCRLKITLNTKKKSAQAPFGTITIAPRDEEKPEIIEKDVHYGLFILGTEKHESRRIDNQLRGRA